MDAKAYVFGAVNHLPKNSRKLPKFLRSSWKETWVIWCNNIGLNGAVEVSFKPAQPFNGRSAEHDIILES